MFLCLNMHRSCRQNETKVQQITQNAKTRNARAVYALQQNNVDESDSFIIKQNYGHLNESKKWMLMNQSSALTAIVTTGNDLPWAI